MNGALWIVAGLPAIVLPGSSAKMFVPVGDPSRGVEDFSPGHPQGRSPHVTTERGTSSQRA
ncbi:hypothetical protein [Nonomuraea dietziae]|uniref:Uncharacterized protein n=1 Tax=Nonomuraea dietziae TaxID=65515 RepID=A0A7W5V5C0_9ACTN|nr:hypothetical protein [Nonomuraea dietziae]MBB3729419.1 hypothetical protein [Nonomuraea dietziae]